MYNLTQTTIVDYLAGTLEHTFSKFSQNKILLHFNMAKVIFPKTNVCPEFFQKHDLYHWKHNLDN